VQTDRKTCIVIAFLFVSALGAHGTEGAGAMNTEGFGPDSDPTASVADGAVRSGAPESLTVRFYGKIYLLPSADSPLMGIKEDGGRLPVYRRKDGWVQVGFHNGTGWLAEPGFQASATGNRTGADPGRHRAAETIFAFCSGFACLLLASAYGLWLRGRRNRGGTPAPIPPESAAPDSKRLVVLFAGREKIIESGISGVFISLEKVFRDIGFTVVSVRTASECARLLASGAPAVLGIDGSMSTKVYGQVHEMWVDSHGPEPAVVFFYNAARPADINPRLKLPRAVYLGDDFTSRHVMEIVAPALAAQPSAPDAQESGPELCALQGKIVPNGLAEILQFLEVGRRTGMLSVEDGGPSGVINFVNGVITFAQTRLLEGQDAVFEILSLRDGRFLFFADKRVRQSNCRLSAFEMLLQWAHRLDETGKFPIYSNG